MFQSILVLNAVEYGMVTKMNKTNDFDKCCMNCTHLYVEDIWGDFMCKLGHGVCTIDIDNDKYSVCDEWSKAEQIKKVENDELSEYEKDKLIQIQKHYLTLWMIGDIDLGTATSEINDKMNKLVIKSIQEQER